MGTEPGVRKGKRSLLACHTRYENHAWYQMQVIIFLTTPICVLHGNFWYLHINSLLEWRYYYFHMFRNPVNQFM